MSWWMKSKGYVTWDQKLSNLWQWSAEGQEHRNWDPSLSFRHVGVEGFPEQEGATEPLFFKDLVCKH